MSARLAICLMPMSMRRVKSLFPVELKAASIATRAARVASAPSLSAAPVARTTRNVTGTHKTTVAQCSGRLSLVSSSLRPRELRRMTGRGSLQLADSRRIFGALARPASRRVNRVVS